MTLLKGIFQQPKFWLILCYNSFLLISEYFTVHYVLISLNRSEHLYSFSVCKPYSLRMQRKDSSLSFPGLLLLNRLSRFGFCKNKWKSYQFPLDLLIDCNIFSAILHQIQHWFFCFLGSKVGILNIIMLTQILFYQKCKQHVHSRLAIHLMICPLIC